jgi:hypothetical protein
MKPKRGPHLEGALPSSSPEHQLANSPVLSRGTWYPSDVNTPSPGQFATRKIGNVAHCSSSHGVRKWWGHKNGREENKKQHNSVNRETTTRNWHSSGESDIRCYTRGVQVSSRRPTETHEQGTCKPNTKTNACKMPHRITNMGLG